MGIRIRVFLFLAALAAVVVFAAVLVLSHVLDSYLKERFETQLERELELGLLALKLSPPLLTIEAADQMADRLAEASDARVTIIDEEGHVLGDSLVQPDQLRSLDNHLNRPEVQMAYRKGRGLSSRYSSTVREGMLYVARTYEDGANTLVLRISRPIASVESSIASLQRLVVIAGLIGLGIALALSAASSLVFSSTLKVLVDFAKKMADGERIGRLTTRSPYVLSGLAGSLNSLSEQLEGHVSALAEERDRFVAVLDGLSDAVLALDENKRITLINRAGILLLAVNGEPVGNALQDIIGAPELHDLVDDKSDGEKKADEVEFDLPGEKKRRILARANWPKSGGVIVALQDVTDLRRLENMRRDFVSNVSHELRTPVSVIQANTETLLGGALEDREAADRFLHSTLDKAERLSSLISDLLDISRIESGKFQFKLDSVPLTAAMRRAAVTLEPQAIEKRFTIQVEPCGDLAVKADARALDQILCNLIENAVKYAPSGGRVVLRAAAQSGQIRIEVEDNGPGVPAQYRSRLFERFFRVDPGRSRKMGGTGLGLAIVKHLVLAQNGEVGMEPAAEKGSVFWFNLPAA